MSSDQVPGTAGGSAAAQPYPAVSPEPVVSPEQVVSTQLPSALVLGWWRGLLEIRQFLRERDAVVFTLAFPVVILGVFGSVFAGEIGGTGIDFRQVLTAGMIGSGIMGVSLNSLAIAIAIERDDGTLKRLRGTPMPRSAYFVGKIIAAFVLTVAETTVLLGIGVVFYGLDLPSDLSRWFTFGWVLVLGLCACTILGVAVSSIPRSGRSAAAVVSLPFLVLQFISGVFFLFSGLPPFLQQVAALFPLKWMCQGLRSVFLPDQWLLAGQEPTGDWEHGRIALVLTLWCVVGLIFVVRTFRWRSRRDG